MSAGIPWRRFVALGDSLTEGVGDPRPGGGLRGWADRMAAAFASVDGGFAYANLARRGLTTEEVRRGQLEGALSRKPDLAGALMGMNDLLDPAFDPSRFESRLDGVVGPLRERGAEVLTATFPDVTAFSPLPARFLRGIRARLLRASEAVRTVSRRRGALCLDLEAMPEARQREVMSVDRLHPSPKGHVQLARAFSRLLGERAGVPLPLPAAGHLPGRLVQTRWLLRHLDPTEVGRFVYRFYLAPRRA